MRDRLTVAQEGQARLLTIALASAVPDDRETAAVVQDVVEAEPVPRAFGDERVHLDHLVRARAQADQAVDDQVAECRVVVMPAALLVGALGELSTNRFGVIGRAGEVLGLLDVDALGLLERFVGHGQRLVH